VWAVLPPARPRPFLPNSLHGVGRPLYSRTAPLRGGRDCSTNTSRLGPPPSYCSPSSSPFLLPFQGCPARTATSERVLLTAADCTRCLDQAAAAGDVMPIAQKVRHHVYAVVDATRHYSSLLDTAHFDGFVRHMVPRGSVAGLLAATLQAGRLEDAARLVQQVHCVRPIAGVDDATSGEWLSLPWKMDAARLRGGAGCLAAAATATCRDPPSARSDATPPPFPSAPRMPVSCPLAPCPPPCSTAALIACSRRRDTIAGLRPQREASGMPCRPGRSWGLSVKAPGVVSRPALTSLRRPATMVAISYNIRTKCTFPATRCECRDVYLLVGLAGQQHRGMPACWPRWPQHRG